jgi:DNA-binding Lrp family transcriptional regulator
MDNLDEKLVAALRRDGRAGVSKLAVELGVSRATIRTRMQALEDRGDVLGYSVVLKSDLGHAPVRGLMMIAIEGRGSERVIRQMAALPSIDALHTTNGKWDLIAEISAESLEGLDQILRQIRLFDGVMTSETNLLLATRKAARVTQRG